jgi:hypothetical protein
LTGPLSPPIGTEVKVALQATANLRHRHNAIQGAWNAYSLSVFSLAVSVGLCQWISNKRMVRRIHEWNAICSTFDVVSQMADVQVKTLRNIPPALITWKNE